MIQIIPKNNMQNASHAHKWTNILAEELRAQHRPYAYKTTSGKQANETLATNQLTNTAPYVGTSNQGTDNMRAALFVQSAQSMSSYWQRKLPGTGIYLRQAHSIQQKKKHLRQRQVFDTFDRIQQFSYIRQKHHPTSQYCALELPSKQKHKLNTVQQIRQVQTSTPLLIMPPIQPVRTIFQPIPVQTIVQSPPQTYTFVHTPQVVQKIRTLSQAHKMAGLTSPNKNMAANHHFPAKMEINGSNYQFDNAERILVSPYQKLDSPHKYPKEWSAQSGVEQVPKLIITEPPHQPDENEWNMPEENIGRKIIAQTEIWKGGLPSTKRGRNLNDYYENDVSQAPKLELNQSLQIFNGNSHNEDSAILFSQAPK